MKKILSMLFALLIIPTVSAQKLFVTYDAHGKLNSVELYREGFYYPAPNDFTAYIYDMATLSRETYIPEPVGEEYPAVYQSKKNAISTFALVRRAYSSIQSDDLVIAVEVLFQGKAQTLYVPEDVFITSAPESAKHTIGESALLLQSGDVINFTTYPSGKINGINIVGRFGPSDIVTSDADPGKSFENLYGQNGYVTWAYENYPISDYTLNSSAEIEYHFGVVYNVKKDFFLLSNKSGNWLNMEEVGYLPETIVYTCDVGKNYKAELGDIGAIQKTLFSADCLDDNGNIIGWSDDTEYIYALARTIDGIATDIVVFSNFI